jgi:hypothetical protein
MQQYPWFRVVIGWLSPQPYAAAGSGQAILDIRAEHPLIFIHWQLSFTLLLVVAFDISVLLEPQVLVSVNGGDLLKGDLRQSLLKDAWMIWGEFWGSSSASHYWIRPS